MMASTSGLPTAPEPEQGRDEYGRPVTRWTVDGRRCVTAWPTPDEHGRYWIAVYDDDITIQLSEPTVRTLCAALLAAVNHHPADHPVSQPGAGVGEVG